MGVQQGGAQEVVQPSIEHRVHGAVLIAGAVVFDQPVGLQRVRADLAAEGYGVLAGVIRLLAGLKFLQLTFVEPGLQDLHVRIVPNDVDFLIEDNVEEEY